MPIDDLFTILDEEVDARIQYANIGFTLGKKLNLGGVAGSGGGIGAPPGGFAGQLAQRYVTYDTSEAATFSGNNSLVDNLNHIRARLVDLEENPPVGTFLDLTDTPDSYLDAANKYIQVNAAGDALIFSTITTASGAEIGDPLIVGTPPNQVTIGTLDTDTTGIHINRDKYLDLDVKSSTARISWGDNANLNLIAYHDGIPHLLAYTSQDNTVAMRATTSGGMPLVLYNSGFWSGVMFGAESPESEDPKYFAMGINQDSEGLILNYQDARIYIGGQGKYIIFSGGNIYLDPLHTVDGVDISAHVADSNPHATAFIDLIDAPLAYENPYDLVRVNATADALEFVDINTALESLSIEAVDVAVDTSTFTRILSSGDTTVQAALNTLDQAITGAINNISWYFDGRIVPLETAAQYVVTKTTQLQDVYIYSPDPGVAGTTLSNIKLFRDGFDYGYILDSDLSLDYSESYTVNDNLNTTILEPGDILTLDIIDTALAVNGLGIIISTKSEAEPATIRQSMISFTGELTTTSNPLKIYNCLGKTQTITKVLLAISTPPTGADIIVNVYKNGNSIFASPDYYPRITVGNTTGAALLAAPWEANTYLTAAIIQTGSGNPGADLTVHLVHY